MKKANITYLFLAAIIFIVGCAKDGATGPAGPTGSNGTNGAANVTTTNYTASPGNWNTSGSWWKIDVPVSSLTDATKDVVLVYVKSGSVYWAMPAVNLYNTGDNYQFSYVSGSVTLWYYYTSAPTVSWDFKIVVIPPSQRIANPNWNNYKEVQATFNLKD